MNLNFDYVELFKALLTIINAIFFLAIMIATGMGISYIVDINSISNPITLVITIISILIWSIPYNYIANKIENI